VRADASARGLGRTTTRLEIASAAVGESNERLPQFGAYGAHRTPKGNIHDTLDRSAVSTACVHLPVALFRRSRYTRQPLNEERTDRKLLFSFFCSVFFNRVGSAVSLAQIDSQKPWATSNRCVVFFQHGFELVPTLSGICHLADIAVPAPSKCLGWGTARYRALPEWYSVK